MWSVCGQCVVSKMLVCGQYVISIWLVHGFAMCVSGNGLLGTVPPRGGYVYSMHVDCCVCFSPWIATFTLAYGSCLWIAMFSPVDHSVCFSPRASVYIVAPF